MGVNAGFYTLLGSKLLGSGGKVFAFEPRPANLGFLREHLRLNHVLNVQVIGAAVGVTNSRLHFVESASLSMGRIDSEGSLEMDLVSIDELVVAGTAQSPHLIKMHIEGGEVDALNGAKETLVTHRPQILLATHGWGRHQDGCEFLRSLGYRVDSLAGGDSAAADEPLATQVNAGAPGCNIRVAFRLECAAAVVPSRVSRDSHGLR